MVDCCERCGTWCPFFSALSHSQTRGCPHWMRPATQSLTSGEQQRSLMWWHQTSESCRCWCPWTQSRPVAKRGFVNTEKSYSELMKLQTGHRNCTSHTSIWSSSRQSQNCKDEHYHFIACVHSAPSNINVIIPLVFSCNQYGFWVQS